jgi:hypothetical protein
VALGAWASDGSVLAPLGPPPPSLPSLDGNGFDVDEPCPETQLLGSGIDYRLMENQVGHTYESVNNIFISFKTKFLEHHPLGDAHLHNEQKSS